VVICGTDPVRYSIVGAVEIFLRGETWTRQKNSWQPS
jgi:hypothetical protein